MPVFVSCMNLGDTLSPPPLPKIESSIFFQVMILKNTFKKTGRSLQPIQNSTEYISRAKYALIRPALTITDPVTDPLETHKVHPVKHHDSKKGLSTFNYSKVLHKNILVIANMATSKNSGHLRSCLVLSAMLKDSISPISNHSFLNLQITLRLHGSYS